MRSGRLFSFLLILVAGHAFSQSSPTSVPPVEPGPLDQYSLKGDVEFVHDPSVIRENRTHYLFDTDHGSGGHLTMRCSTDRQTWKICGHVFDAIPAWMVAKLPNIKVLWAPDISYFSGSFHLYYVGSVFGKNTSVIGLATNVTLDPNDPDYQWVDRGEVIESTLANDYNTIDPNILVDGRNIWLNFGSYWTGIKQRSLNPVTGMLSATNTTLYSLARRSTAESPHDAIEAPALVLHRKYYYLFVSFDQCCRGAKSTYRIMVGRSRSPHGPFMDRNSVAMLNGGGTELLRGNAQWAGPGGQSVWLDHTDGDLIVFHAYAARDGHPWLHVRPIEWKHGWPVISPEPTTRPGKR